jgi:thymidylate synthase ThyX
LSDFTPEERAALAPHFTHLDRPVFALTDLPEVVKGALFARYSRSPKSLRRLYLDEFRGDAGSAATGPSAAGTARAEKLYEKVFVEYGDDSVAQLGGVHLACEDCSNVLTKVLEWGRLMAYLEQSTRYVPYADRPDGRYRYHIPREIQSTPLEARYTRTLDLAFETYARWLDPLEAFYARRHPNPPGAPAAAWRRSLKAKVLDTLRGLLPAATQGNVGLYGTGQAYEALLLRMRAHPLAEVRQYAEWMLEELRKVIPAFLQRVDRPDRGGRWTRYLAETRSEVESLAQELLAGIEPEPRPEVVLCEFDPEGEIEVVAAALYAVSDLPDDQLRNVARQMSEAERERVLAAYVGERENRRHKPGRAFERTTYRFDILADYGAFRDLQRHRMLTLEWQALSPHHGHVSAEAVAEAGAGEDWQRVMDESAALYHAIRDAGLTHVAPYAVCMAYRVRFYMQMNAREALHVIELRTAPAGHPAYRRICQEMHRLIAEQAGHRAIAAAMRFADHSAVELERLAAEQATERRWEGRQT